ncbi:hypothetical protein LQZ18_08420 [Lachnospiraceae bacterium ZAX-1]
MKKADVILYPGLKLINVLKGMGIKYLFRLSSNDDKIGLFKRALIGSMVEEEPKKREKQIQKLQKSMEKYSLPYCESKGKKREFRSSNKNKRNLKRTF